MLEFKNISKNYRKKAILENINFKICKGEKVGLLGTSGAGKTTLMKLIAKSQLPTQGHIFYNGIDINSKDNVLNDFAFMINQIYFPEISARKNLEYYLEINNKKEYSKDISKILNLVALEDNSKKVKYFSYGMKQRLCLALCLIIKPKVAILDEPFLGLDPIGVQKLITIIEQFSKENDTIFLISSHQLKELEGLCTRFLLLNNRKITEIDAKEQNNIIKLKFKKIINNSDNLLSKFSFIEKIDLNIVTIKNENDNLSKLLVELGDNSLLEVIHNSHDLESYFYQE